MPGYLLSGLQTTGKTTIGNALAERGFEVINADKELGYYANLQTGEPVQLPKRADRAWFKVNGWSWKAGKLRQLLSANGGRSLIISGGSRNEQLFYELFDKIFVLHISDATMRQRLEARGTSKVNTDLLISRMVEFNQQTYQHARDIGAVVIETEQPLEACINQILSSIHES
jgi:broad-specificity NMP kinase